MSVTISPADKCPKPPQRPPRFSPPPVSVHRNGKSVRLNPASPLPSGPVPRPNPHPHRSPPRAEPAAHCGQLSGGPIAAEKRPATPPFKGTPLFRSIDARRQLTTQHPVARDALAMVKRRARRPPVVLSREEVRLVFSSLDGVPLLVCSLPYGALYDNPRWKINPAARGAPLRFGTRDLKSFLTGALDEVAIYPRVLSAKEVLENYTVGTGK